MAETADREDWKSKYRDLLTELERKEGAWQTQDEALRGVASRLAIAAMGRDEIIDKHVSTILDVIKGRQSEDWLTAELDGLAAAVLRHEKHLASSKELDLSGFVANLAIAPATQKRLIDALESDDSAARLQALGELANELNALLQTPLTGEPDHDPYQIANDVIATLASHMENIPGLELAVTDLKQKLDGGISHSALDAVLKNLADAVGLVVRTMNEDRQELETFLEEVTKQLAQFEEWARGNETESEARREDADSLERNVEQQVGDLQSDMDAANEMADLKQRVQSRLDSIADQFRQFRQTEEKRAAEATRRNASLIDEVNRLKVRTHELAERCNNQEQRLMHDTLTGVYTRYAYDQRLQEEFQRWQRHGLPLTYSIWDLDHFKKVNDGFGHQAGDRLLAIVAGMLSKSTRAEDFVARIGGEEFVVLFPATDLDTAHMLSERLREKVEAVKFHFKGTPIPVTVSCGLTDFRSGDTPQAVYERADKALYRAKDEGRNCCVAD